MKLVVLCSHPIQYYAPWFRHLAAVRGLDVEVLYLWNGRTRDGTDPEFGHAVEWDRPLLDGYEHSFLPNESKNPGTEQFEGLYNPTLRSEIRRRNPDAALMLTYNYRSPMELILCESKRTPLLFRGDSFELPRSGIKNFAKLAAKKWIFSRFARLLYVGELNRRYYEALGIPSDRLFFAPHCIENEAFRPAKTRCSREGEAVRFGFFGKLVPGKRVGDLIRAFRAIDDAAIELLIVGSGPLRGQLEEQVAGDARVRFHGFANQSEMPALYAACDAIVLPSESETWGLCVNEAMAAGCATVVSDRCGCVADLVVPGQNGFAFTGGNVDELEAALRRTIDALRSGRDLGARSQRIVASYSYRTATRGLVRALESLE